MQVGIAGAGIMGRLLAFALAKAGQQVTLFDFTQKANCSRVAAGLLTPVAELDKSELIIYHMGRAALLQHWPHLLSQLSQAVYFKHSGSLVLSHARDQTEMNRFMQKIQSKMQDTSSIPLLNTQGIEQLEPSLSHFKQGYYFAEEGQIDNQAVLNALETELNQENIHWEQETEVKTTYAHTIVTATNKYHFDLVIDCRGLGATDVFKDLRALRVELIWLHAPHIHITRPIRLMHPRYPIYLVPRPHDIYLVGASEIESDDDSPISVLTTLELLSAAYSIHTGFSEARIVHTATQCRPTLSSHLPQIKYAKGWMAVNGLYRHGFLIAPTLLTDMITAIFQGISAVEYPTLWEECA